MTEKEKAAPQNGTTPITHTDVTTAPTSAQQGRVRRGQAKRTAKLSVPAPARKNCAASWPICVLVKVIIPPSPPSAEK